MVSEDFYIKWKLSSIAFLVYGKNVDKFYDENDKQSVSRMLERATDALYAYKEVQKLVPVDNLRMESEIKKMVDKIDSEIPTFEISSGKVKVTDPCYAIDTWCSGQLENVRNGTYYAFVDKSDEGSWGIRVSELQVVHKSFYDVAKQPNWIKSNIDVGVDSGQAGFFDYDFYASLEGKLPNGGIQEGSSHDKFYEEVCELTSGRLSFGTTKNGVVSSSGYGDGSYDCYYAKDGDEIVAMKIIFINEEEDEDEEWNEDEE